jgi:hypothetical protein
MKRVIFERALIIQELIKKSLMKKKLLKQLDLGTAQNYMGLKYHIEEALKEFNNNIILPMRLPIKNGYKIKPTQTPKYAIFAKKYYNEIKSLNHNKIYDYCFIGSIASSYENRKWVIEFAKKYFTNKSIFINTDNDKNWVLLGDFDLSHKNMGFCPKKQSNNISRKVQYRIVSENIYYFETMCQSKFILCPAGDTSWSFRFYECLLCESMPIVLTWHHTYRTAQESTVKYKYILVDNIEFEEFKSINDDDKIYNNLIEENTDIFKKYHMINAN